MGAAAAALAAVGNLTTLVEAASLAFLFTFCVVSWVAYRENAGSKIITGFGAAGAEPAGITLIVRLVHTDPLALLFLASLAALAVFGRPILLRQAERASHS
ncbi:MAG: hypothetical protein R2748_28890 [Bryobacterales bacterium]